MGEGREVLRASASASSAYSWVLSLLDEVGSGPPKHPSQRQCPAHEDETPSLSVARGDDGRALLHCHTGCSLDDILKPLAIGRRHLFTPSSLTPAQHARICHLQLDFPSIRHHRGTGKRGGRSSKMKLEAIHEYGDYRLLRYRHPVTGNKSLEWEHRGAEGVWLSSLGGARLEDLPLYMEDQVLMGVAAGEMIVVVESESSVDAFVSFGVYATTWAGGARAPQVHRLADVLAGAQVMVIPDHDEPGLACGRDVAAALRAVGANVTSRLPINPGEDARDLLRQCGPPPWPT